jgi:hypothetical protein
MAGHVTIAQKTDRILLDNHDWITGEIKKLDYGKVSFKTDAAGTIQIKWDRILQIKSDKFFEIGLGRDAKHFGSLDVTKNDEKYKLLIIQEEGELEVDMNRVVELTPIKNKFWSRIDGNLDMGFSYTKGSDVKQWNSNFNIYYRVTNSLTTISGNSIYTAQPENNRTSKQDLGFSYKYFTKKNFAYSAFSSIQQNSELGLELRTSLGLGYSKSWLRSNSQRLITTVGCIVNQEKDPENKEKQNNMEGLVRIEYNIFRYRDPQINLTSYFDFYPSFTVKGRYRTDLNIQLKYELFNNFYLGLTFYHNLDTKPPESALSSSDWGITNSISWTF